MSSAKPPDNQAESNGQLLPERVAELAGELTEAEDVSLRRRLAKQIPELASRSGQATMRGLSSGTGAARRGVKARTSAASRRVRPARDVTARGVQSGRGVAVRGAHATGEVARKGMQAGGSATWRGVRASGQWLTTQVLIMAPRIPIRTIATLRQQHHKLVAAEATDRPNPTIALGNLL